MKVPTPWRRTTSPSCSNSLYALTTVLGLIRECLHYLLECRELIPDHPSEHHLAAHLPDQLSIDRHPGTGVDPNRVLLCRSLLYLVD